MPVLQNLPYYAEASHVSGSCFIGDRFTWRVSATPARSSPQAFSVSEELPATPVHRPACERWGTEPRLVFARLGCSHPKEYRRHVLPCQAGENATEGEKRP